ncbi:lysozyme inhibitor LprI family protein [Enterobacteriaceae bacterium LUAb1]
MPMLPPGPRSFCQGFAAFLLFIISYPALAIDCQRANSLVENTICSSPQLRWLDLVLTESYIEQMPLQAQRLESWRTHWTQEREACSNQACVRRAYLKGLSDLYQSNHNFDWQGEWWNSTAPNGSGGHLAISHAAVWSFKLSGNVWAGVNKTSFSGDASRFSGTWLVENIPFAPGCTVILIPRPDGKVEVSSSSGGQCSLLTPSGVAVDGVYVKATHDPRPPATLLTLGILPVTALDKKFRQLAGADYQKYVDTANSYVYGNDLDNLGATVMTMWVKGAANKRAAVIMYTKDQQIWAMRAEPDAQKQHHIRYITTEKQQIQIPKTLAAWRSIYDDTLHTETQQR